MRPRDLLLCIGALALTAAAGFVALGEPTAAGTLAPPHVPIELAAPAPDDPPEQRYADVEVVDAGPARRSDQGVVEPLFSAPVDTTGWTKGVIRGDVRLAASTIDQITSMQIVIDELRALHTYTDPTVSPFRMTVPVELGIGTPTFEIKDVPFSDYGYVVRVHVPGLNGSQQTVSINAETPLADNVVLSVTSGAPFSLLLRDQDQLPIGLTEVRLRPVGEPQGRPWQDARTDNFGSAVFACVLAGDYQVLIGPAGQYLLDPPPVITMQPGGRVFAGSVVQPQGQTLQVPRGQPLKVVARNFGYGVEGVAIRLQALDRVKLTVLPGQTDVRGEFVFPHVLPGVYQLDLHKDGFLRRSKQLTITKDEAPPDQVFDLLRS